MITRLLIGSIAHCIAILPEWCVAFLCQILGRFFFLFFRRRRRIILSNLAHTFPEKTETECKIMARISCVRMVELGVLAIVLPYFSEKRIRRSFSLDSSVEEFFREREQNDGPCIVLLPHFSQMEAMTVIPLLNGAAKGYEIGVIYRPFKNKGLEQWIHKTRERFGLKLLSRKNGFSQAKEILRRRGIVVILFDQNAGEAGILSTFLGRVASTTFLPDLLFRHFHCPVYMFMPQRLGFFRGKCFCERLDLAVAGQDHPGEKDTAKKNDYCVTHAMNTWLERKLLFDYDVCCDWLWAHNRWHTHDEKHNWLNLLQKRSAIDFSKIEKRSKIFMLRMPHWLGDTIMLIPFIRAVRQARPDGQIIPLAQPKLIPLLENLNIADRILPVEKKGGEYYRQLIQYRRLKPDIFIRFINSLRGDIETLFLNAKLTLAQRFPQKKRPLFSEFVAMDGDSLEWHQIENFRYFAEKIGYNGPWDLSPFDLKIKRTDTIGLICGSKNYPQKRWPIPHWIGLIETLLKETTSTIVLFGTTEETTITQEIKNNFPHETRLVNRVGETNTLEFAKEIASCKLVIGNDTGGVHLSNLLAIPTVALFGPTNPNATRPFFNAPVHIIRAPDQKNFASLTPDFVAHELFEHNLLSQL